MSAIIDDADAPLVAGHRWCAFRNNGIWYARYHEGQATGLLHRIILGAAKGQRVDHRNGDGLDCRRGNLRVASVVENARNGKRRRNNTSGATGVSRISTGWRAYINVNRRQIPLGVYQTIAAATEARKAGELRFFGEFAPCLSRAFT
jgi:hypothetical protein